MSSEEPFIITLPMPFNSHFTEQIRQIMSYHSHLRTIANWFSPTTQMRKYSKIDRIPAKCVWLLGISNFPDFPNFRRWPTMAVSFQLFQFPSITIWWLLPDFGRLLLTPWRLLTIPFGIMMTSSNGNIFRVTGHLCGEFTGPRWIPRTKASDAELWCFLWTASQYTVEQTIVRLVI